MTFSSAPSLLPDPIRHAEFYAGVPLKRGIAWIVDTVLVAALTAVVVLLTAFTGLFILPVLWLVLSFVYRWVTMTGHSATWGMRLTGIRFLTREGERFDAATAFLHTLGYSVSVAFVLPQVISVGLMLISPRGQGLTDHLLGTVAINRPSGE